MQGRCALRGYQHGYVALIRLTLGRSKLGHLQLLGILLH